MKLGTAIRGFAGNVDAASRALAAMHGRGRLQTAADMVWCAAIYGTGTSNYTWYRMWERPHRERKTFLTQRDNERLLVKYNPPRERWVFDDKVEFAERFQRYFRRAWLPVVGTSPQAMRAFVEHRDVVIAKPRIGRNGRGIEVLTARGRSADEVVAKLLAPESGFGIVEEFIVQHEELARVYADAVSVVRIVTVIADGRVHCPVAAITFACSAGVSNLWQGGLYCMIDVDSGEIVSPAITQSGDVHRVHPHSGRPMQGMVLPFWPEAVRLVEEAARVIDSIGYVGWDLAITEDGPLLIEGNTAPGYAALQHPAIVAVAGGGVRPRFERFL